MFGEEHALVDERTRRKRADVEVRHTRGGNRLFNPLADQEQRAFDLRTVRIVGDHVRRRRQHDLFDFRACGVGLFADHGGVHGHLTPSVDVEACAEHLGLHDRAAGLLCAQIRARQKDLTDRNRARLQAMTDPLHLVGEEALRNVQQNTRAVAGLAVGVDRSTVPNGFQGANGELNHLSAGFAVLGAYKAHAAGVPLSGRVIGVRVAQALPVCEIAIDRFGHRRPYSAATGPAFAAVFDSR